MKNNQILTVTVTDEEDGLRLDKYLTTIEEVSSRHFAKALIEKNLVTLNGKIVKPSAAVKTGQVVLVELPPLQSTDLVPYEFPLDIVFEDQDLLVVNKPSGLVVHPAAGHQQDTLVNALLHYTKDLSMKNEQRPGIVHRIDKDTSGLLVVAKNDATHEGLSQQFKDKTTHRVYWAVIQGQLPRMQGICQSYLARHVTDRKRYASIRENNRIISESGLSLANSKWAVTHYKKIQHTAHMTYLELQLETGRTHQIRVHMSELGHPLLGDLTYGFSVKKYKELSLNRFYLHAGELGFVHPKTRENLLFKTKWPEKDRLFIQSLGFSHESLS